MSVDLRHLETFVAVAREQHVTRAAETLHYAQSTVSAHVQALERELGLPLFDREGRGVRLTEAGARLRGYADRLLALEREARRAVADDGTPTGQLVITAGESLCTYRLPALLTAYQRRHPAVRLSLLPERVADRLVSGTADVGVEWEVTDLPADVASAVLTDEPLVLVAPVQHHLAQQDRVEGADLADEPLLLTEPGCYHDLLIDRLKAEGVRPTRVQEFVSIEAIKQCVMAGMGLSFLPEFTVRTEIDAGRLAPLNLFAVPPRMNVRLLWHGARWRSPAVEAFLTLASEMLGDDRDHAAA